MLKEVCLLPQALCNLGDSYKYKDVKSLLENIRQSGYILAINNKEWMKEVRTIVNSNESLKIRDSLNSLITNMRDRGRIHFHPKPKIEPVSEDDWYESANELNSKRAFDKIVTDNKFDNSMPVSELEDMDISEIFGLTGTMHTMKTKDELKSIFIKFLSYAKKLTVIDPYFNLSSNRYKQSLEIMAESLNEKRGFGEKKGNICINCKYDSDLGSREYKKWQNTINDIFKKYGHIVTINVWAEKTKGIRMHERYLIADKIGLVAGAGLDCNEKQQSEWSIKEYNTLDEIRSQYTQNAGIFDLKYKITGADVEKY